MLVRACNKRTLRGRILREQQKATAQEVAESASASLEQSEVYRMYLDSSAAREERSKQVLAVHQAALGVGWLIDHVIRSSQ
eukprot:gene22219-29283_t